VLIDQRLNEGVLGGLWEVPGGKLDKRYQITLPEDLHGAA
jgi:hypothetical protein